MTISIKSNIAAMNAQRRLGESTAQLSQSFTRLSSGLRINRASDDAAGLAIASGLNADARTYAQGIRNINDALSVLDVTESALGELSNIVNRQLELAQQAANGVLTLKQRRALDKEVDALTDEYNRIIRTTGFNGFQLLDGSTPTFQVQAGYSSEESLRFALGQALGRNISNETYTQTQILAGGNTEAVETLTVDLNGDGNLDLVTASNVDSEIRVQFGLGDGTFGAIANYVPPEASGGMAGGDLNGDGHLDLVVTGTASSTYSVLLGNGNGSFRAATSYAPGLSTPGSVFLADVDYNGKLDLVIGNEATGTISVLSGLGGGTFGSARSFATGLSALDNIAVGDINNDGLIDVGVVDNGTSAVMMLLGGGGGSFGAARSFATSTTPVSLAFADLDDNGQLDVLTFSGNLNGFDALLGNGDGSFQAGLFNASGADTASNMYTADFNGDGFIDLLQLDGGTDRARLSLGNGNGTFRAPISLPSNTSPTAAGVGDFNRDGVIDIAVINHNGNAGTVYVSGVTTTPFMPRLNINTQEYARETLTLLQAQRTRITQERGNIGAMQSRLGFAVNVLEQRRQNYVAASSAILDADVAVEAAQLVRNRILQQAGAAILAQANQSPALALVLLKKD